MQSQHTGAAGHRAQRFSRKHAHIKPWVFADTQAGVAVSCPATSSGSRCPVRKGIFPRAASRGRKHPSSERSVPKSYRPVHLPTSVPGRGPCGCAYEGDPRDPAPSQAGPYTQ